MRNRSIDRTKKSFVIFVALTCLAGLVTWFWWQRAADIAAPSENFRQKVAHANSSARTTEAKVTDPGKSSPAVPLSVTTNVSSNQRRISPLYEKFRNAKDLGVAYAEFAALAKTDPEAQYFQAKILELCTVFQGPILERLEERIEKSSSPPERKAAAEALKSNCKDVPARTAKVSSGALIQEAAVRGDAKSRAHIFRFEDIGVGEKSISDTQSVRELALSQDPVVLNNLDGYFQVRNKKLLWNIPGVEGTVSGAEMSTAFKLVACDLGYDCSVTSIDAQIACAYRGYCDGDRVAQIQNNLVSPTGFGRVQEIRKAILLSFSTGRWPDGFWSGSDGSAHR